MLSQLRPAIVSFVGLTIITGAIYPVIVTGIAKVAFPKQADGSLIERDGKTVGSSLIAQGFTEAKYFWPRPSAASYNGAGGSGSNLGPSNPALVDAVKARIETLKQADPTNTSPIPVELVTASASGLDPHLSPAAVEYQLDRVAKARDLPVETLRAIIRANTTPRLLGILGEPTVNVLQVNLDLDAGKVPVAFVPATQKMEDRMGYRAVGFMPETR